MVCLGLEPGAAGWKMQTNPLSYGGTPTFFILKKIGPTPASFSFIFSLFKQTLLQFLQQINVKNVMSIQYTAPGFEPTTFGSWASSHYH